VDVEQYLVATAIIYFGEEGADASWLLGELREACPAEPCDVSILRQVASSSAGTRD
tara:strand:- start:13 stop:180 length:168 start_codon:yes stop_codon:yes gene_type:complete